MPRYWSLVVTPLFSDEPPGTGRKSLSKKLEDRELPQAKRFFSQLRDVLQGPLRSIAKSTFRLQLEQESGISDKIFGDLLYDP